MGGIKLLIIEYRDELSMKMTKNVVEFKTTVPSFSNDLRLKFIKKEQLEFKSELDAAIYFNDVTEHLSISRSCFEVDLNSKRAQNYRCEQMEKILKAPSKLYIYIDGKYVELKS